jgi:hypothetical protein
MTHTVRSRSCPAAAAALVAALAWADPLGAQTVTGQARAVQATVLELVGATSITLSDTGTLTDSGDAREASQTAFQVPSLLAGHALHATTIGWPDQVTSEASMASMALTVAGTAIGADFVMAEAVAILGAAGIGTATVTGLIVNGLPIAATGAPNQIVGIPGGRITINEQTPSAGGIVVNALHLVVDGFADVVIASATAGIQ